MKRLALSLLCFFCVCKPYAEEKTYIQTELLPKTAHIGDSLHLILKIFRPEDSKIKTPNTLPNLQDIEMKDFKLREEKTKGKYLQTILDYTLVSFKPGSHTLEPISIELQTSSGEKILLQSDKIPVEIESLVKDPSKEKDIRGPKPQLHLKGSWLLIFLIVIFLAFLIAIAWFIAKKTLLKPEQTIKEEIKLSPDEEALLQLEDLLQSSEMKQKNMKAVYTRLTDILRNYLGKRYLFDAREMTSLECLKEIKSRKLANNLFEKIKLSLEKADLVKFAKFLPETIETPQDIETAKNIVVQSREIVHAP